MSSFLNLLAAVLLVFVGGAAAVSPAKTKTATSGAVQATYLGCFNVNPKQRSETFETLTPRSCVENCDLKGLDFAGVLAGNQCHCTLERPGVLELKDEAECNVPCSGDAQQICGGYTRIGVYSLRTLPIIDYEDEVEPNQPTVVTKSPAVEEIPESKKDVFNYEESYLGCFMEHSEGSGRALQEHRAPDSQNMTRQHCRAACEQGGFQYFGVENWFECFCGNTIHNVKTAEEECNSTCTGDYNQTCGGWWRISIYKTALNGEIADKTNVEEEKTHSSHHEIHTQEEHSKFSKEIHTQHETISTEEKVHSYENISNIQNDVPLSSSVSIPFTVLGNSSSCAFVLNGIPLCRTPASSPPGQEVTLIRGSPIPMLYQRDVIVVRQIAKPGRQDPLNSLLPLFLPLFGAIPVSPNQNQRTGFAAGYIPAL